MCLCLMETRHPARCPWNVFHQMSGFRSVWNSGFCFYIFVYWLAVSFSPVFVVDQQIRGKSLAGQKIAPASCVWRRQTKEEERSSHCALKGSLPLVLLGFFWSSLFPSLSVNLFSAVMQNGCPVYSSHINICRHSEEVQKEQGVLQQNHVVLLFLLQTLVALLLFLCLPAPLISTIC